MGAGVGEEDEGHVVFLLFSFFLFLFRVGREGVVRRWPVRVLGVRRGTRSLFVSEAVRSGGDFRWFK